MGAIIKVESSCTHDKDKIDGILHEIIELNMNEYNTSFIKEALRRVKKKKNNEEWNRIDNIINKLI